VGLGTKRYEPTEHNAYVNSFVDESHDVELVACVPKMDVEVACPTKESNVPMAYGEKDAAISQYGIVWAALYLDGLPIPARFLTAIHFVPDVATALMFDKSRYISSYMPAVLLGTTVSATVKDWWPPEQAVL